MWRLIPRYLGVMMDSCITVTADMVDKTICFPMPSPGNGLGYIITVIGVAMLCAGFVARIIYDIRRNRSEKWDIAKSPCLKP